MKIWSERRDWSKKKTYKIREHEREMNITFGAKLKKRCGNLKVQRQKEFIYGSRDGKQLMEKREQNRISTVQTPRREENKKIKGGKSKGKSTHIWKQTVENSWWKKESIRNKKLNRIKEENQYVKKIKENQFIYGGRGQKRTDGKERSE